MPYVLPPSSLIEPSPQLAPTFHKQLPMAIPTRPQAPSLSFPAFDAQDASDVSSSGTAVPFPKIPGRKRRVRGVGSQPWHLTPSESSDEEDVSPRQPAPVVLPPPGPAPVVVVAQTPTPVPGRHRNLRLNLEGLTNRRALSESQIPTLSATSPSTPQLRKKNGELLKSSLKSPSSSSIRSSRSSMPTTPSMEKIVHFDAQLEYVKLFNKEQKPAAVSRDASPCESEDDSDRQLIIGRSKNLESSEDEKVRQGLTLESINAPLRNAEDLMGASDVKLEKVSLAPGGRTIQGTVLVRNLAFEKWIAIRFTFDWWQTISEVTAKYLDSLPEQNLDRFEWSLRVPDIALSKIEERRLFLVVRYNTAGREIWDNNNSENYQYKFKVATTAAGPRPSSINDSRHPPSWPVKSANTDQLADLRKKLERVVQEDEESKGVSSWESLTAKLRARNIHLEEDKDSSNLQLKKRYNFSEASKSKWEPPKDIPRLKELPRMLSVPLPHRVSSASPARGSPRDSELGHSPKFFIDPRDGDSWSHHQPTVSPRSSGHRGRQHQRGGYFVDWESSVKLTPTSSNTSSDQSRSPSISPSVASTLDTSVHSEDFKLSEPSAQDAGELSESESCSSTTSSSTEEANTKSSAPLTSTPAQQPFGMDRSAMRFNSYPMDRSHLTPPAPATEQHVQPAPISSWTLSDSVDSIASTPSITSASTPSQCPSSPLESLPDSFAYGGDPFASIESRRTLQQSAYDYFLSRFCYYTGAESNDFRGHRQTHSDSNLSAWSGSNVHPPTHRRYSSEGMGYTASKYEYPTADLPRVPETESGATTPTQLSTPKLPDYSATKGMVTPRAGSPVQNSDLERTPRQTEIFVRPIRSSL